MYAASGIMYNLEGGGDCLSPEDILTVEEAAVLLSLHPHTVRRMAREGRLPAGKIGDEWRFSRRALVEWIEKGGEAKGVAPGVDLNVPPTEQYRELDEDEDEERPGWQW